MKLIGPDSLTVTKAEQGDTYILETKNVLVGEEGGLTRAYFVLRIDSGRSSDGKFYDFFIGAVREGVLDHDECRRSSNNAWCIGIGPWLPSRQRQT